MHGNHLRNLFAELNNVRKHYLYDHRTTAIFQIGHMKLAAHSEMSKDFVSDSSNIIYPQQRFPNRVDLPFDEMEFEPQHFTRWWLLARERLCLIPDLGLSAHSRAPIIAEKQGRCEKPPALTTEFRNHFGVFVGLRIAFIALLLLIITP